MKEVTIRQLAAAAGVSTASVSRVLNNDGKVTPRLRDLVLSTARQLGYSSSNCADGKVIVIIMPGAETPMFHYGPMLLNALIGEIFRRGYRMEVVPETDIALLNERIFCGAISITFRHEIYQKWGNLKNIPLVCINDFSRHIDRIYSVCSNEPQGMRLAIEYLARHGHRDIGLLLPGTQKNNWCRLQRRKGFEDAIRSLALRGHIQAEGNDENAMLEQLLDTGITALIAPGESGCGRIPHRLKETGLKIPEQLSLITWEVERTSAYFTPPHTTLAQDFAGLGRQAVDIVEKLIGGNWQLADLLLDYSLIERRTVAAPHRP